MDVEKEINESAKAQGFKGQFRLEARFGKFELPDHNIVVYIEQKSFWDDGDAPDWKVGINWGAYGTQSTKATGEFTESLRKCMALTTWIETLLKEEKDDGA